jgi:hypothetical protein
MLWSSFDNVSAMTLQRDDSTLICRVKSGAATTDGARAAPATGFYAWVELVFTGTWQILRGWSA